MIRPIGAIQWPDDLQDAVRLYRLYVVKVIDTLGIYFDAPTHDPLVLVKGLLAGQVSDEKRRSELDYWWSVVDEKGVRDFQTRAALLARLSLLLVGPSEREEASLDLGEELSWFLQIIGFLGADTGKALDIMHQHFEFSD